MRRLSAAVPVILAVVLAFVVVGPSHATLIGLWQFDEGTGTDVADSSGNGLDGDLRAQTGSNQPDWISGHTGTSGDTALRFGVGGSLNMVSAAPSNPVIDSPMGTNAITMAAWISSEQTAEATNTTYGRIIQRLNYLMYMDALPSIDSLGMSINLGYPAPFVDLYDLTETAVPVSVNSATDPEWTHVAVTYDGSDMKMYVNGSLKYTYNQPGAIKGDWWSDVQIGNSNRPEFGQVFNRQFVGAIDDMAYFDTALDATQISQIMGGDFSGFDTRPVEGDHLYGAVVAKLQPTHNYHFGTTGVVAPDSGFGATLVDGVLQRHHGGARLDAPGPGTSFGLPGLQTSSGNGSLGVRDIDGAIDVGSLQLSNGATDWATEQMTFSGWVMMTTGTDFVHWDRIFTNSQNDNHFQITINDDDADQNLDGLYITTNDDLTPDAVVGLFLDEDVVNLMDTQWHHLFVVRNGDGTSNLSVVIDGVDVTNQLTSSSVTPIAGNASGMAYLGGMGPDNDGNYTGLMDEVSIWVGEALTVADGISLYSAGDGSLPLIPGDANVDGTVDESDAEVLAENWGKANANWVMGDFNKDGSVGAADAAILAANWGQGVITESNPVPEPSTLVLAALGAAGLAAFSRRRKR